MACEQCGGSGMCHGPECLCVCHVETARQMSDALLEADIVNARAKVLRAARGVVRHEGARHSVMSLKHALIRFDAAIHKAYAARKNGEQVSVESTGEGGP